ncbi:MAG: response regulator [Paenibacillaceae bacterium]|nr:response regulator [Paenibacillaceae bacterium]
MKAILIDDERNALLQLKWLLENEPDLDIVGAYQSAEEALVHLSRERVQLVFLDIEMSGMSGLEAAEAIYALDGEVRIVFVTAFSSYALEAFRVSALDYVMKPIDPARFAITLERVRQSATNTAAPPPAETKADVRPVLKMFGQLSVGPPGGGTVKWRTLKSKELFAYLLEHRGVWMSRDVLLEEIWPAFDLDKALVHLHTAVYQIRRMLRETGIDAALDYSLESYCLQGAGLETDAERFQQAAAEAAHGQLALAEAAPAWEMYAGHYLDKEDYDWAKPRRERLLQGYVAITLQLVADERASGASQSALRRAGRACGLHPYSERLAKEHLACLADVGDAEQLRRSYAAFCDLYEEEWGTEPSADFRAYGRQLIDRFE